MPTVYAGRGGLSNKLAKVVPKSRYAIMPQYYAFTASLNRGVIVGGKAWKGCAQKDMPTSGGSKYSQLFDSALTFDLTGCEGGNQFF
jgi:hypothetical protein